MDHGPWVPLRYRGWLRGVLGVYWLAIFALTHWPDVPIDYEPTFIPLDKAAHFTLYGGLAGLLSLSEAPRWWADRLLERKGLWRAARVLGIVLTYGVLDEWTQPWFGRFRDVSDWLADSLGAVTAVGVLQLAERARVGWRRA